MVFRTLGLCACAILCALLGLAVPAQAGGGGFVATGWNGGDDGDYEKGSGKGVYVLGGAQTPGAHAQMLQKARLPEQSRNFLVCPKCNHHHPYSLPALKPGPPTATMYTATASNDNKVAD